MSKSFHRAFSAVLVLLVGLAVMPPAAWAGPTTKVNKYNTTSGYGVIPGGQKEASVTLALPTCPTGTQILVTHVLVAPVAGAGNTLNDVVNLGRWSVSVPVRQQTSGGSSNVPVTLFGNGPQTLTAELPAGQGVLGSNLQVMINLLPFSAANTLRHEFSVHVTTACGIAFVGP